MRKAVVKRATKETDVEVSIDLDGTGTSAIATGIEFLDHMLDLLARHSRIDIAVRAKGDLRISIIITPPRMSGLRLDRRSSRRWAT